MAARVSRRSLVVTRLIEQEKEKEEKRWKERGEKEEKRGGKRRTAHRQTGQKYRGGTRLAGRGTRSKPVLAHNGRVTTRARLYTRTSVGYV